MPLRAIIDTNVFLSALWSRNGAAFQIFALLGQERWQMVISNHLLFEYEEVAKRYASDLQLSVAQIDSILDGLAAKAEAHPLDVSWVPRLPDPDDEPLLQLAAEARVPIIVTRDLAHLEPAKSLGIEILTPPIFLARLRGST